MLHMDDTETSPAVTAVIEDAAAVVAAVAEVDPDLADAVASVIEEALAIGGASEPPADPAADASVTA